VNNASVRQGEVEDEKSKAEMNKALQDAYGGILNGLKKMYER